MNSESDFLPAECSMSAVCFGGKIAKPAQQWCATFDIPLRPFEKPK